MSAVHTLAELFETTAGRGDAPFLAYLDDLDQPPIEQVSYSEFHTRARTVADQLLSRGIRVGDRVALVATPRVDYTVAVAGAILAGAVPSPINHHFKVRELSAYFSLLDPAVVVVDDRTEQQVKSALGAGSARVSVAGISGFLGADLVLGEHTDSGRLLPVVTPEDTGLILHSSGTTGLPKAVVRRHGHIAEFLNFFETYFADDEHLLNFLPLYHQAGLVLNVLTAAKLGADLVQQSRYSTTAFWDLVDRYHATHMNLMAPVPSYLLAQPPRADDRSHSLKWTVIAGRNDHWAAFQERFGVTGMTFYGSTETLQITSTGNPQNGPFPKDRLESVQHGMITGGPLNEWTEFRLIDENNVVITEPDVQGCVQARGKYTFTEYLHAPKLTEAAFTKDGWFITGDIGYATATCELVLIGRAHGMIRKSGENIAPREIELVLEDHPDIDEALVVGIPDDLRGHEILARIVPREESGLTPDQVFDYLDENLSAFKVPRFVAFRTHFEHTPTFKIKLDHASTRKPDEEWFERTAR
jgi:carnitine-CoA ligase